jgi:AbrB family looped-hinge helix DNA binding protein
MIVKISSKGQITVPMPIRTELNIKKGMYLDATVKNGVLCLEPLPDIELEKYYKHLDLKEYDDTSVLEIREATSKYKINTTRYIRNSRDTESKGE